MAKVDTFYAYECYNLECRANSVSGVVLDVRTPFDEEPPTVPCPLCQVEMEFRAWWEADNSGYGSRGDRGVAKGLDCCKAMKDHLAYRCCDDHGDQSPDRVVLKSAVPEPDGRYLLVGQNAAWDFEWCPWCGARFQLSLEDENGTKLEPGHRRLHLPSE